MADTKNETENTTKETFKIKEFFDKEDYSYINKVKENEFDNLPELFVRDAEAVDEHGNELECTLFNEKPKKRKFKKYKQFLYYTPKQLEKVKENNKVIVIGQSKLTKSGLHKSDEKSEKKQNKDENYVGILNVKYGNDYKKEKLTNESFQKYDIKKPSKNGKCVGYVYVGDNQYVKITKVSALIMFLIFMVVFIAIVGILFSNKDVRDTVKEQLNFAGEEYDGEDNVAEAIDVPQIEIPGFTNAAVNSEKRYVKLQNPEGNQSEEVNVALKYCIYIDENKDGESDDLTGDGTIDESDAIMKTDWIKPGFMVKCDMYQLLKAYGTGEHTVKFVISCKDMTTLGTCNGATQTITYTVV